MRLRPILTVLILMATSGVAWSQYNPRNTAPPIPPATIPTPTGSTLSTQTRPATPPVTTATTSESTTPIVRSTAMPESMDKIDDKRTLISGDVINFRVVEDNDQPRSIPINDSGEIEVPYIGRVTATGKTLRKLADDIKALLEKDYYYQATVLLSMDVMNRVRGKIYVLGQVHSPGGQEIPNDEVFTVSKAILRAGGFGDFADKRKVKLVRKKTPDSKEIDTTIVDCVDIFEKGDPTNDKVVQPEDVIIIPQRLINF